MSVWSGVDRSGGPCACWPWTRSLDRQGYGQVRDGGTVRRAHAVAYEAARGPVRGDVLRHLCAERSSRRVGPHPHDDRRCCNPAHLEAGSYADNARDTRRHGRARGRHSSREGRALW